jgi:O-succinylbenzoic acid--CoA ligase
VLSGLSSVREAAVVGLEDQRWGEVVAAAVVATDPGDPPSIEDMRTATRELLAGFKVPTVWVEVVSLPRNAAGKVDRRAVRRLIEGVPA